LRSVFQLYLWLSVGLCFAAAAAVSLISPNENAKLVGAALGVFGGAGIAFARSWRQIEQPRWWHWMLGSALIAPAVLIVLILR
jgi:hypothetical protein